MDKAGQIDSSAILLDALRQLTPESRDILWLREVEGYSSVELADILEVPIGTARSRLHLAREQLRQVWTEGRRST